MTKTFVAAALAIALAACGSGGGSKVAAGDATAASSPAASSGATSSAHPSTAAATGKASTKASPSPGPSQYNVRLPDDTPESAPGTEKAPLTVTAGLQCVTPGTVQTLTITSHAELQLSYATLYPDGSAHKEYGGQGVGTIPPGGKFTTSWTVPATAPLGEARTDAAVAGKIDGKDSSAFAHAYWVIKRIC